MTEEIIDSLNWLHCLFQELHANNVELPLGDYDSVYYLIETLRDQPQTGR